MVCAFDVVRNICLKPMADNSDVINKQKQKNLTKTK